MRQSHLDPKLVRYARARQRDLERQEYARALRAWLSGTDWTHEGLAERIGVSKCSVDAWAMGTRSPSEQSEAALIALGFEPPTPIR